MKPIGTMNSMPPPRHSPAAERNKASILDVLRAVLGPHGEALEIASGTGQHVAHFAAGLPGWTWQPSDVAAAPEALAALDADIAHHLHSASGTATRRVRPAVQLDVLEPHWRGDGAYDAIFCANLLHIAPWPCCAGLMRGAARQLRPAGALITYGPYFEGAVGEAAPGNVAFDADLRTRDPAWGIRQLADVAREAEAAGLALRERVPMPANNLCLIFTRGR